jgi:hypothetical protein
LQISVELKSCCYFGLLGFVSFSAAGERARARLLLSRAALPHKRSIRFLSHLLQC